ncbi:MAG: RNase adapter RapZ [Caldisericia bacterium]|nr:RNase adapter RapZ [Caldisericia bacterium]
MPANQNHEFSLFIVTGLSGAGKTQCLKILEDLDYYCVDNLPIALIIDFADLLINKKIGKNKHTAIVVDVRGGNSMENVEKSLHILKRKGVNCTIIFMEASDEILVRRFSETRRKHPLSDGKGNLSAIITEKGMMNGIRSFANYIIDTTDFTVKDLKEKLVSIVSSEGVNKTALKMTINILSFGYKRGIPIDADLVFDVRFLPNPFYVEELKNFTGIDLSIQEYVIENNVASEFLQKTVDLLMFLIPQYFIEGKTQVTVAFGCTGGRHRSVAVATTMTQSLNQRGFSAKETHRDINEEGGC